MSLMAIGWLFMVEVRVFGVGWQVWVSLMMGDEVSGNETSVGALGWLT